MHELFHTDLTVSELTSLIKRTLEEGFYGLKVTGEISNFRPSSTGHWFFTLKDANSQISAVMFKGSTWKVDFTPSEGDKVTVTGNLDVYGARGTYQIKCESMEKAGQGEILALLQARKRLYASKGYFDESLKKPIPSQPHRVGVVTSATGAALQDILNVLNRRSPSLDVLVLPAVVQGESSAASIANRIMQANSLLLCDVLIVGRGGGSLEDLLPFSEEVVLEAMHESEIPIISAVGHEIDWALSDYVADLRAPTPSAAAELVSQGYLDLRQNLKSLQAEMQKAMQYRLTLATHQLGKFDARQIHAIIDNREYLLANASQNLINAGQQKVRENQARYESAARELQALSPLAILARGYAAVQSESGTLIKSKEQATIGEVVRLTFVDGKRTAQIKE
ncbi:exodeoxyribonuclease VII large subunit [Sphaerochaeta sp. S2]|uniref:exodeoxyribonuclease VII large subunit n=1 Tax=Sphaerochaeta sp. S2 TaxID=2798868 RepID=UPI0018E986EA|nr:exodeoxyribonuclease VII large subunit [Sphaerochaeta sp. S2]MBJ2357729.1 exodeoxyribonuclease VII large subunit [Sphaerochaeta sp. S2]MCK9347538.1 exodeoxyribonuclease VII large subunit [Sphaerochaeta sp.]MDD4301804.1 exodeoxyribonuclease VII large subunit [Sphaerochaeta sp.]MDY0243501.1 exodeoxyribonuclease VII large subunit [Sphaerochaeta sp.]